MPREHYKLFSQASLANLTLKNRLVRSATYEAAAADGTVTERHIEMYRALAEGGVGLIITGHMAAMPGGRTGPMQTCIYEDAHVEGVARIVDAVRTAGNGCNLVVQISHVGRQVTHENTLGDCVAPSEVPSPILKRQPRALAADEVEEIIVRFAGAIRRAKEAGADGAQIHAAHGWLLSSFLSPYTNRREDRFGGSAEGRATIVREILTQAREQVGAEFPILIKMNCDDFVEGGVGAATFPEMARIIERTGVDAIEVSGGMWDCLARPETQLGFRPVPLPESRTGIEAPEKQSYFLKYAEKLSLSVPVILVGGNRNVERMEEILRQGAADFFALCRPLIREPDLPNRWLAGAGPAMADCLSCNSCLLSLRKGPTHCLSKKKTTHILAKNVVRHLWRLLFK